jgi:hypothetical protein
VKKTCAILLLAILSFNWIGYQLFSDILENKASAALDKKIDQSAYDDSRLKEIRVPLNAPYMSGVSATFERFEGDVEVDGVSYRYVKRRIDNGELVLLCLPNDTKTKFEQTRVDFFKLVNDLDQNTKGSKEKQGSTFKSFTTDYKQECNSWTILSPVNAVVSYTSGIDSYFPSSFPAVPTQPPRA